MPLDGVIATDKAEFIAKFGHVFEHSPWVVERAWAHRPFADAQALHAAFMAEVEKADGPSQQALIDAHPELAARIELTDASQSEQTGAGLKNLTEQELFRVAALNAAYREKFGFPFIICVRLHTKTSILDAFAARLVNDAASERKEAINQIGLIAKLRLQDLLEGFLT